MKTVAILGPTASGKTDLSLDLAARHRCAILSLDSLSVYREIDIASAKPTPGERGDTPHFGIDLIAPDEPFNAALFHRTYEEARAFCRKEGMDLLIVGGSAFYLKSLMEGLSPMPPARPEAIKRLKAAMADLKTAYGLLKRIDPAYAGRIAPKDRYRIERGLFIHFHSGQSPSDYFRDHPPRPTLRKVALFEIAVEKPAHWRRIEERTEAMFRQGLVDEVARLEKRYGRAPHPMKAIGLVEVLDYFDGRYSYRETKERIAIHTRQLAKRQKTFNRTQFPPHPLLEASEIVERVSEILER
ncbi:tRNA (adenosine(37)-N6)-dimethylallyltransferase MiaA [Hydrogenimonas sp.]